MNKESYNKICDQWTNYRSQMEINRCIVEFSRDIEPYGYVLDVGCGTGYPIASYLDEKGFNVTGIDISENMIEKAKSLNLTNSQFYVCDILDYETEELYDAIIAFDSLFHLDLESQKVIYKKLSDLLIEDGYLLFTHGLNYGEIEGEMFGERFHYSSLDASQVYELLQENGFMIISWAEHYHESSTGERDLLVMAQKVE